MVSKATLMFVVSEAVTYATQHGAHVHLNDYWSQAVTGALVGVALAVEKAAAKDGVKGAILALVNGVKKTWNPNTAVKK